MTPNQISALMSLDAAFLNLSKAFNLARESGLLPELWAVCYNLDSMDSCRSAIDILKRTQNDAIGN